MQPCAAAAALGAARLDDDVADLARVAGRPLDDLAAEDQAAADPGADERGDHVAVAPPGAEAELAVAADPDVVLDQHRPAQDRREVGPEREVADVQVGAEEDHARSRGRAGRASRRRPRRRRRGASPASAERLVDALDDRLEDRLAPLLRGGRALGTPEDLVVRADDARQDLRPAQVDPQDTGRPLRSRHWT